MINQKYLKDRYEYDPKGFFFSKKLGILLKGTVNKRFGYRYFGTRINGKTKILRYSRMIFLFHKGYLPKEIDHKNRIKLDDRIENLRPATRSQNCANRIFKRALPKGVYKNQSGFYSMITVKNKVKYLGRFKNKKEASLAFNKEHSRIHGSFSIS